MALNLEVQLGGKARGTQHAHRVFLIALLGRANQANQAVVDVMHTTGVVDDAFAVDIEIQRINGEIAAQSVLVQAAVHVIAQQAAAGVGLRFGVVAVVVVVGAEGRHFNHVTAKHYMQQLEAPADQAGIAEHAARLFGGGAGGDVKVFGV